MRKSLRDAMLGELTAAQTIAAAAEKDDRDLTDTERDTITGHLEQARKHRAQGEAEDALRAQMSAVTDGLALDTDPQTGQPRSAGIYPDDDAQRGPRQVEYAQRNRRRSLGKAFVESAEYKALMATAPNQQFSDKMRVQSAPVPVKELLTGGDHDTSAGALVQPDYRGMLDPFYQRPLTVRDLVAPGRTGSDTIEYVRMVSVTNRAAPVPEATTADPIDGTTVTAAAGGRKPESAMTFERDSTTVKTIAHWIPATKRALSDAAQVRTLIDEFLRYGLEETLEDQMLAGDGVGDNFLGLANTSGVQVTGPPAVGEDVFDISRRARRMVRIGGRAQATAYVMNPIDWETVELARNDGGDFYGAGPFAMTPPRLWGLPVVESETVPTGTLWVGAWNFAVLYDREQATVQATDTHEDFFTRNLVAILAEMRAGFAVLRPSAFVRAQLA